MKKNITAVFILLLLFVFSLSTSAHFQMLLPSDEVVMQGEETTIDLNLLFTHPMSAEEVMDMDKPVKFGVYHQGESKNLLQSLQPIKILEGDAYAASYKIKGFGDFIFFVEPAPYWEEAEDKYITHCTKVVVNSMGVSNEWDHELGMKAEIVPLTRPYGLWTGNVFRGIVKKDGKPVPYAEIEVEFFNQALFPAIKGDSYRVIEVPDDTFITQIVKADGNGVFAYGIPGPGWWGFAALLDGEKIEGKDHELGALIWVKAYDMK